MYDPNCGRMRAIGDSGLHRPSNKRPHQSPSPIPQLQGAAKFHAPFFFRSSISAGTEDHLEFFWKPSVSPHVAASLRFTPPPSFVRGLVARSPKRRDDGDRLSIIFLAVASLDDLGLPCPAPESIVAGSHTPGDTALSKTTSSEWHLRSFSLRLLRHVAIDDG